MDEPISIHDDYSINALVAAVINRAQVEASKGDETALAWLMDDAPLWADAIGIDLYKTIPRWIARGCKQGRRRLVKDRPTKATATQPAKKQGVGLALYGDCGG